jgi:hypothetical protein
VEFSCILSYQLVVAEVWGEHGGKKPLGGRTLIRDFGPSGTQEERYHLALETTDSQENVRTRQFVYMRDRGRGVAIAGGAYSILLSNGRAKQELTTQVDNSRLEY